MDNQAILLNNKWRNYFNWTILYPAIFFASTFLIALLFILNYVVGMSDPSIENLFSWTGGVIATFFFGIILFLSAMFIYLIWFIIASDTLFNLLGINRVAGNVLNIVGLLFFGGLPFLILPIFFWIKMRDYWHSKGQNYSWRAVAID